MAPSAAPAPARGNSLRKLGSTGLTVSDIGIGLGYTEDPAVIAYALDRGVTLIETAEGYLEGRAEEAVGKLKLAVSRREQLVYLTKLGLGPQHTKQDVISRAEACLRRMGTDYVDILMLHAVDSVGIIAARLWVDAMNELKQAGKVRHIGLSGHGKNLAAVLQAGSQDALYEVFQIAYNFLVYPTLEPSVAALAAVSKGVIAMKVLAGARLKQIPGLTAAEMDKFPAAASRWTLSRPGISCIVGSMRDYQSVDHFLAASGQGCTEEDERLLDHYRQALSASYCRPGCAACERACPRGVPISDILRFQMYFSDYHAEKLAMVSYAAIPAGRRAQECADCAAPCQQRCPYGVPVARALAVAHKQLAWPGGHLA